MPEVAIPLALLAVIAIAGGGATALRLHHSLPTVIAFSGGIVVAVALLEVLPEAIESVGDAHDVVPLVALGFLGFFLLERVLVLHHRDDPEQARAHGRVGVLGAMGLSLHTFTDGVGIGLAFSVNAETGLLVLLAVVGHGFADGLNTVSFVLSQNGDVSRAKRWLRIDALAPSPARPSARRSRSPSKRSAISSPSTPAFSSTWAPPTCSPPRMHTSTTARAHGAASS
jgi:zinc transporter ZupT